MSQLLLASGLAIVCFLLPSRMLILMSLLGVMLADTPILPREAIYFSRFVPSGVLALRTLQLVLSRGRVSAYLMINAWLPFSFLALLSIAYSVDRALSAQRLLSALFIIIGFGAGVPLFFPRIRDHRRLMAMLAVVLGGAVLYSLFLTTERKTGVPGMSIGRARGLFSNPNTLGLMAMQAAFPVFYWWQKERRPLRRQLQLAVLAGIAITLLITGSRASALGLAVGGLVAVHLKAQLEGRVLRRLFQLAVLALVVLLFAANVFPELADNLFRTDTESRTVLWQRAWILAQDHLFFGVGFSASDGIFLRDALYMRSFGIFISGSHSSLMRLLVDLGLVGVALAVWAFARILSQARRHLSVFEDPLLGTALFAAIAASVTNSLFEAWMFGFGSAAAVPFWLFLSLLSYQTDVARQRTLLWRRHQAQLRLAPAMRGRAREPAPEL